MVRLHEVNTVQKNTWQRNKILTGVLKNKNKKKPKITNIMLLQSYNNDK